MSGLAASDIDAAFRADPSSAWSWSPGHVAATAPVRRAVLAWFFFALHAEKLSIVWGLEQLKADLIASRLRERLGFHVPQTAFTSPVPRPPEPHSPAFRRARKRE
eukprot:3938896-Rhodomonas_salina.1